VPGRAVLVVCAAAALLVAGCKPSVPEVATAAEEVPSVPGTTYEVKLAHCPTPLQVSLPTGFLRERSAEVSRKKAVCQPVATMKTGTYECFFESWEPDESFPHIQVEVNEHSVPGTKQGQIDRDTWQKLRARQLGVLQQDERAGGALRVYPEGRAWSEQSLAKQIRGHEQGAPTGDTELRARYPHFFRFPADVAPHYLGWSGGYPEAQHYYVGRRFYAQRCVVDIDIRMAKSDDPISTFEAWLAAIDVK